MEWKLVDTLGNLNVETYNLLFIQILEVIFLLLPIIFCKLLLIQVEQSLIRQPPGEAKFQGVGR